MDRRKLLLFVYLYLIYVGQPGFKVKGRCLAGGRCSNKCNTLYYISSYVNRACRRTTPASKAAQNLFFTLLQQSPTLFAVDLRGFCCVTFDYHQYWPLAYHPRDPPIVVRNSSVQLAATSCYKSMSSRERISSKAIHVIQL